MPIHDWTRVPSGLFHDFHQRWTAEISNTLNRGIMPAGYYAYVEQRVGGDLAAGPGVAVREFPLARGHGFADYLLYADRKALGAVEAKKEGDT